MLDSITNRLDNITNRLDNVIVRLVAYYIAISLFFESILRLSLGHRTMSFILAISSPLQSGPEIGSLLEEPGDSRAAPRQFGHLLESPVTPTPPQYFCRFRWHCCFRFSMPCP